MAKITRVIRGTRKNYREVMWRIDDCSTLAGGFPTRRGGRRNAPSSNHTASK